MLVAYYSLTGNVKRFIEKLGLPSVEIDSNNPFITVDEPYIIVAPTYDEEMTEPINDFIEHNSLDLLQGVVGSGNLNFADLYVFTAKDLATEYNVPHLYSFEYSGTPEDVTDLKKILEDLHGNISNT